MSALLCEMKQQVKCDRALLKYRTRTRPLSKLVTESRMKLAGHVSPTGGVAKAKVGTFSNNMVS